MDRPYVHHMVRDGVKIQSRQQRILWHQRRVVREQWVNAILETFVTDEEVRSTKNELGRIKEEIAKYDKLYTLVTRDSFQKLLDTIRILQIQYSAAVSARIRAALQNARTRNSNGQGKIRELREIENNLQEKLDGQQKQLIGECEKAQVSVNYFLGEIRVSAGPNSL